MSADLYGRRASRDGEAERGDGRYHADEAATRPGRHRASLLDARIIAG